MPHPSLLGSPDEVLRYIVLFAVGSTRLGPAKEYHSLSLTCRSLNHRLSFKADPTLHADILSQKFDRGALDRHFGQLVVDHVGFELPRRFMALKCIRRGRLDDPELLDALYIAFMLFLEDEGRNFAQLQWAGLHDLVHRYLREKMSVGSDTNGGWPLDNEINTLVITLAWLVTTRASVETESEADCVLIKRSLSPFVYAAFQYPCSMLLENSLSTQLTDPKEADSTALVPRPRLSSKAITYFGHQISVRKAPIALFALLLFFSRLDRIRLEFPYHLPPNRAAAEEEGRDGLTWEDIESYNSHSRIHFPSPPGGNQTRSREKDYYGMWVVLPRDHRPWLPLDLPLSYVPGSLTGHWQGSSITPLIPEYEEWMNGPRPPSEFGPFGPRPLYFTLREHVCYSPSIPVPLDRDENGIMNAWLPEECQWTEHENGIEFFDQAGSFSCFYETISSHDIASPVDSSARYRGIVDVIVTGTTNVRRAAAWGHFNFIGRVRLSDGQIVLLRKPADQEVADFGSMLLRGNVMNSRNFVGRWRGIGRGDTVASIESVFVARNSGEP